MRTSAALASSAAMILGGQTDLSACQSMGAELNPAPGRHYVFSEGARGAKNNAREHTNMSANRLRVLLVSLLAVFAVSAVASASASAHPAWTVNGVRQIGGGTETITSKGGVFKLTAPGLVTLECTAETDSGTVTFTEPGEDAANITFTGCKVVGNAACVVTDAEYKVPGSITVSVVVSQLVPGIYDVFSPPTTKGETFVEITLTSCGALNKTYEVKGKTCGAVGPQAVKGKLTFSKANSEACGVTLKLGTVTSTLAGVSEQEFSGAKKGSEIGAA
jgi:hypothetical protein